MANRAVVVDLLVRTNQFTAGLRRASHDMASETTNMETKVRALQMQIGLLGVGMVAFAAVAVSKWAEFDHAMARTEATGGEAAKRIQELNEVAKSDDIIRLGYNAIEASDGIYELTKAGVSASDILGGALTGALSLAAAESLDAEEAARMMASALTQFNLEGKDSAHVADLLTAGAVKAQGSAHELGFALKQSGLVANQFGMSIEETTGTLALFASAGLIGSDAGTSLRTMLLHLAGPSTKAAKLMKEIGLEVYGANGQMVSMEELADNLQASLGKLGEEQRNQALATIFGADATRAASLLYREGGDAVREWIEKVDDAGFAASFAAGMLDSLNGDIEKLSATWTRSMIEMGESADAPLRKLVQGATFLVDRFSDLDPAVQGVLLALVGGGGLVTLGILGFGQLMGALRTLQAGLVATGVVSQATAAKMGRAFGAATKAGGILAAAAALLTFADAAQTASISSEELQNRLLALQQDAMDVSEVLGDYGTGWAENNLWRFKFDVSNVEDFRDALELLDKGMDQGPGAWFGDLIGNDGGLRQLGMRLRDVGRELGTLAAQDLPSARVQFNAFVEAAGGGEEAVRLLLEAMPDYRDALYEVATAQGIVLDESTVLSAATGELYLAQGDVATSSQEQAAALDGVTEATAAVTAEEIEAKRAHEEYVQAIVDSFTSFFGLEDVYQSVIDQQKEWAQSAAEATDTTKDSWEDFYDGVSVSASQYIAELEAQVLAQEQWAANLIGLAERAKAELPANMQVAAQEMIEELRALGPEGAAQVALLYSMTATELATVVELYNRQGVAAGEEWAAGVEAAENPEVAVDTAQAEQDLRDLTNDILGIPDRRVSVTVDVTDGFAKVDALQTRLNNIRTGRGANVAVPRAGGGPVFGPGTGTSDSVPALLSNGEHVLTASDVEKAGGHDAIYRLRSAIQSGLLRFASGGAVNGKPASYWRSAYLDYPERLRLWARIQKQQAELAKTGEDAVTGVDRQVLIIDIQENRKKLADAEFAASLGNEDYWSARATYAASIGRGNLTHDLTGGRSSAADALADIRDNVLPGLTGNAATALADALQAAESAAGGLYDQMDAVDEALKSATDKAEELQGISDSVKSGLVGGFSLGRVSLAGTVNPFTGEVTGGGAANAGQGMLRLAQAYAAKVKTFSQKLKALADKGFAGAILQEVASMGAEAGIPAADALLALNLADATALNQAYADIANFGGAAGQAVTEGFYEGGLAAAEGLVAGLRANKDQVQAAITDMAMAMQEALKAALGIASPSRKFRALMNFVGQGVSLGLDDQQGIVADASARLFSRVMVPGWSGGYGFSGSGSSGLGDITARFSDEQVERLAVAFETGNVRNINAATAQRNRKMELTYGARGR